MPNSEISYIFEVPEGMYPTIEINEDASLEDVACKVSYTIETSCNHSWKTYVGLTDSFEYCEHCDTKR